MSHHANIRIMYHLNSSLLYKQEKWMILERRSEEIRPFSLSPTIEGNIMNTRGAKTKYFIGRQREEQKSDLFLKGETNFEN